MRQRYAIPKFGWKITDDLLSDLDKETVEFQPNYDDSLREPAAAVSIPNLLINGSTGIAVGMATICHPIIFRKSLTRLWR